MGRFIEGADRAQATLLPEAIDGYVGEENPVRVVDAFVDALDLAGLGFDGVIPAPPRVVRISPVTGPTKKLGFTRTGRNEDERRRFSSHRSRPGFPGNFRVRRTNWNGRERVSGGAGGIRTLDTPLQRITV